MSALKHCNKCDEDKARTEFSKNSRAKDGLQAWCKACRADRQREYRADTPERQREYSRKWYAAHAEYRRAYERAHRAANRERRLEDCRRWRVANTEYRREYRAANLERDRASAKEWREANPDKLAEKSSRYRARKAGNASEPYSRTEIFARWGGSCCYCDADAVALDHVTAIANGGADAARNLVPACQPCNSSKGAKSLAEWAETF